MSQQKSYLLIKSWLLTCLMSLAVLIAGCATTAHESSQIPFLKLSPSSLGREMTLSQRLDISSAGQTRSIEVAVEADAASVRMAFIQLGHTIARIEWDGTRLEQSLAPGWPKVVSAERVLSDLQLVWWPADAIRGQLPPGWVLTQTTALRELLLDGRVMASVKLIDASHVQLLQPGEGYTADIYTQGAMPGFDTP